MTEREVLQLIEARLKHQFDIKRVLLFGSRARGSASSESDFDVLVIADSDIPFVDRQGIALLALGKRTFSIDLLVYTPAEAAKVGRIPGSAVYWALQEGKEIHAV